MTGACPFCGQKLTSGHSCTTTGIGSAPDDVYARPEADASDARGDPTPALPLCPACGEALPSEGVHACPRLGDRFRAWQDSDGKVLFRICTYHDELAEDERCIFCEIGRLHSAIEQLRAEVLG